MYLVLLSCSYHEDKRPIMCHKACHTLHSQPLMIFLPIAMDQVLLTRRNPRPWGTFLECTTEQSSSKSTATLSAHLGIASAHLRSLDLELWLWRVDCKLMENHSFGYSSSLTVWVSERSMEPFPLGGVHVNIALVQPLRAPTLAEGRSRVHAREWKQGISAGDIKQEVTSFYILGLIPDGVHYRLTIMENTVIQEWFISSFICPKQDMLLNLIHPSAILIKSILRYKL